MFLFNILVLFQYCYIIANSFKELCGENIYFTEQREWNHKNISISWKNGSISFKLNELITNLHLSIAMLTFWFNFIQNAKQNPTKQRNPKKTQHNFPPYGSTGFWAVLVRGTLLSLLFCPEDVTVQQNPACICSSNFSSDKQDR